MGVTWEDGDYILTIKERQSEGTISPVKYKWELKWRPSNHEYLVNVDNGYGFTHMTIKIHAARLARRHLRAQQKPVLRSTAKYVFSNSGWKPVRDV